jgi:D-alanyl-lipoteichoic acid acyltransferase DltB (MBOAT superfamily)
MIFNSLDFAIFLPIVFLLYWFVTNKNLWMQNFLIVIASYIFYGWWDWRFLSLMLFSTVLDYACGVALGRNEDKRTRNLILGISLFCNLGLLMFFKYFNFFLDSFEGAFSLFGQEIELGTLNIILPVGISFYTFQTLSYTIDVYRKDLKPTSDFMAFTAYVTFFPQLVAGPIERATHLLPQFYKHRVFDYNKSVDGLRQILWGLFKKVVIADNCAEFANIIFNNSGDYSGSTLVLGAIFFTFQIYGDFSGYSDIAIGTSRLFGFDLMQNFAFPYFSRDIAEFWRRWHISLSTWFRDYLYIPLGGSKGGTWMKVRNTFIIFLVSGFWHGANWTFIAWGALNAIYFLPLLLANKNRQNLGIVAQGRILPSFREFFGILTTFMLTVLAWIFFRADSIGHAFNYIGAIITNQLFSAPYIVEAESGLHILPKMVILLIILFVFIEWTGRESRYAIEKTFINQPKLFRWGFYYFISMIIFLYGGKSQDFIYFQF